MKECTQCGKCCIQYADGGLSATNEELDWWENYRPEIYRFTKNGEIWIDPKTGQKLTRCPWLGQAADTRLYFCEIYFDRPLDCRHYPVHIDEMVRDGCEMIEVKDLKNPKKAQQTLDKIMSDSRPPYR